MTDRNRPRMTVTLDPATKAYLQQPHINAGRLIDHALKQTVADDKLRAAALTAGVLSDSELLIEGETDR